MNTSSHNQSVSSIPINDKPRNLARLQSALHGPQKRAQVRLINLSHLREFAEEAESRLARLGIPKYLRPGCTAGITPEQPPLAYKYRADASTAGLVRRVGGWALKGVFRTTVWPVKHGCTMGVVVTRSDAALAHQLSNDTQMSNFVFRKIAAAERAAAEKAAAQVAAILNPTRLPLVSHGPTIVH